MSCNQINRDEAWSLFTEWTKTESLRTHGRAVELVMRAAAKRYGDETSSIEAFGIAGLLHDADYEAWPEEHPSRIVTWLREKNEEAIAYAISAHYTKWGVPHHSQLDKALLACDELTGFVMAAAKVRPEGIATLTPKSVKKKLKSRSFAAKVDRFECTEGARLLGVELNDHIQFVIDALKPHGEELGITGTQ